MTTGTKSSTWLFLKLKNAKHIMVINNDNTSTTKPSKSGPKKR
jgi:hypothetical protein